MLIGIFLSKANANTTKPYKKFGTQVQEDLCLCFILELNDLLKKTRN